VSGIDYQDSPESSLAERDAMAFGKIVALTSLEKRNGINSDHPREAKSVGPSILIPTSAARSQKTTQALRQATMYFTTCFEKRSILDSLCRVRCVMWGSAYSRTHTVHATSAMEARMMAAASVARLHHGCFCM